MIWEWGTCNVYKSSVVRLHHDTVKYVVTHPANKLSTAQVDHFKYISLYHAIEIAKSSFILIVCMDTLIFSN